MTTAVPSARGTPPPAGKSANAAAAITSARSVRLDALPHALRDGLARSHLPALDGIRAVAAYAVVVFHAGLPFVPAGMGVLAFFVLSGFLITWLLLREDEVSGTISVRNFYVRRSLRIFPPFLCYWLLAVTLVLVTGNALDVGQAVASFLYVNNYYQAIVGDPNTLLSHTWSLGVEEQFYLLWPGAFVAFRRHRARLATLLLSAVLAIWAYRLTMVLAFDVYQGYVYEAFDMRADHLLVGCVLAVALRSGLWPRLWSGLVIGQWAMLVTVAMLGASIYAAHHAEWRYRDTVGFIVDPVLVAMLIVQAIAFDRAAVARWLNWRWVRFLGLISYPVYLYHPVAVAVADEAPQVPFLARLALVLILTTAAAVASYYVVERPVLSLKGRFARPVSPAEMPGI